MIGKVRWQVVSYLAVSGSQPSSNGRILFCLSALMCCWHCTCLPFWNWATCIVSDWRRLRSFVSVIKVVTCKSMFLPACQCRELSPSLQCCQMEPFASLTSWTQPMVLCMLLWWSTSHTALNMSDPTFRLPSSRAVWMPALMPRVSGLVQRFTIVLQLSLLHLLYDSHLHRLARLLPRWSGISSFGGWFAVQEVNQIDEFTMMKVPGWEIKKKQ